MLTLLGDRLNAVKPPPLCRRFQAHCNVEVPWKKQLDGWPPSSSSCSSPTILTRSRRRMSKYPRRSPFTWRIDHESVSKSQQTSNLLQDINPPLYPKKTYLGPSESFFWPGNLHQLLYLLLVQSHRFLRGIQLYDKIIWRGVLIHYISYHSVAFWIVHLTVPSSQV